MNQRTNQRTLYAMWSECRCINDRGHAFLQLPTDTGDGVDVDADGDSDTDTDRDEDASIVLIES